MKITIKILPLLLALLSVSFTDINAQVVTSAQNEENSEAYLKEFDLYTFKDAAITIKDSSALYQHLVGVKYGFAMSSVMFSHTKAHKQITSTQNYGVYYTYLHSLLGNMPFFGIQTGLAKTQLGYNHVTEYNDNTTEEAKQVYDALELPLTAIFRADISRVRLMLGIGGWGYHIYGTELPDGIPSTTKTFGFGLLGHGGIAIRLHPVELHLEASYKYALTEFVDPKIYSEEYWVYSHATQLQFSAGLFFNFGSKHYKSKK